MLQVIDKKKGGRNRPYSHQSANLHAEVHVEFDRGNFHT